MDIRGPRLRKPSERALSFTSSMASDRRIARHVVEVNMAHMVALLKAGEVSRDAGARCLRFLLSHDPGVGPGAKAEDYHQKLEQDAVDSLGVEVAGFLNYGKSRNDQVATAIRMELRTRLIDLLGSAALLQGALLKQIRSHGSALVPGYTHLQRAQPITLAHQYFAHFDALQRDSERVLQLYSRANLSPMGSAAMAGTSVNVDRRLVARLLGFSGVVRNAMDAVSARDVAVEALSCAVMAILDASRLADEIVLWSSTEFGFLEVSDAYAASSSIMPQKKNAVVAELVRAKAGTVLGDLVAACAILKALPYSYNLDLQELTPRLWEALDDAVDSLALLAGVLESATFNAEDAASGLKDDDSTAVGLANYLVKEHGLSFRQAHSVVGELVRTAAEEGRPLREAASSGLAVASRRLGRRVHVDPEAVRTALDPGRFLEAIATEGGSNPGFIPKELGLRRRDLARTESRQRALRTALKTAEKRLRSTCSGIAREVRAKN